MLKTNPYWRALSLFIGFGFLYLPIVFLVVFSFNDSAIMTSWSGFSLKWYKSLFADQVLLNAAKLSFLIAAMTATASVVIGTWAAYVLSRMGKFRGFTLYAGLISAPLVIPEVVLGISLLLMFVELSNVIGWPGDNDGIFTIWVGHVVLCVAYVAVVIQARIRDFDKSYEEAALDLGATPIKVFFSITLPLIMPALMAAWLLAFTLSLDDVVIASFLSGPGYTTLPVEVFSRVRLGLKPEINALATLFIFGVGLVVIVASRLQKDNS